MATGKRYYWIKLKESFLTSDAVDFLMGQKDGANYVVLYQILCLKTINTGGRLERHIGEVIIPYDEAKIQRDAKWFPIDTIHVALSLYKSLGLIYEDQDGCLVLTGHKDLVGSETDYAEKNRRMRANQQALPTGHNVSSDVSENVSTDIEIDIRDKSIEKDIENITLILNDNSEYLITDEYIEKMQQLFPKVNVKNECRKMSAWCLNNPSRRKTPRGITRFINSWLSSEEEKQEKKKTTNNPFLQIAEAENE